MAAKCRGRIWLIEAESELQFSSAINCPATVDETA